MAKALTKSQQKAFKIMTSGHNCFIYGEAGTGKSYLIKQFASWCAANHKTMLRTAFTGIASMNIKGPTIHRVFRPYMFTDVLSGNEALLSDVVNKIAYFDVIVIDEISMVRIDLFEYVTRVIQAASDQRNHPIQVIVTGDFFQLPPVIPECDEKVLRQLQKVPLGKDIKSFPFESEYWDTYDFKPIELTENLRQEHDKIFIGYLNNVKTKTNVRQTLAYFNAQAKTDMIQNPKAVYLAASNQIVEEINNRCLAKIKKELVVSHALLTGEVEKYINDPSSDLYISKEKYPAPLTVAFKKGARVMFLKNNKTLGYRNGTFGTVIDCGYERNVPWVYIITDDNVKVTFMLGDDATISRIKKDTEIDENDQLTQGQYSGEFVQMPFKLGYAVTIHKAQGKTFEYVNFDPNESGAHSYEKGQLYVALSRVKTIDGLHLMSPIKEEQLKKSDVVIDFYNSLKS